MFLLVDWEGKASPEGLPALYHDLPMCPEYENNTADEYVAAVLSRGKKR